jgi:NADPH:quinone reductase
MVGPLTALVMVQESYPVKKGDWILVHAAAGGTGLLLGQVLKDIGAHTIGTVSTKEKAKLAKEAGFEYVLETYDPETVLAKVKELTHGEGVICVYDGVFHFFHGINVGW